MSARIPIAFCLLLLAAPLLRAEITVTFQKIADFNTLIPEGSGNFTSLETPTLSGSNVAFYAWGSNSQRGYYAYIGGDLVKVADKNTFIPEGTGNFTSFGGTPPAIDGTTVAFRGIGSSQNGVYARMAGVLRRIANLNTSIPGGSGNFTGFGSPAMDLGVTTFVGVGLNQSGVYLSDGQTIEMLVNRDTPRPQGGAFLSFSSPSISQGDICFTANLNDIGIYAIIGGSLRLVVDENTPPPAGGSFSGGFPNLSIDADMIVFTGGGGGGDLYVFADETLTAVVDRSTQVPGSTGDFAIFWSASQSEGSIVFLAEGDFSADDGIYVYRGGEVHPIILRDDVLDDRPVVGLGLDRKAMDGNQFAFLVGFPISGNPFELDVAIYLATIHVTCEAGDLDVDQAVSLLDAAILVDVLLNPRLATFNEMCAADANLDGVVNGLDIQAILALMIPN